MSFREANLVLLAVDLAGFTRATANLGALAVAAFLDDWYRLCGTTIRARGGRVVKFMGDGCLATFPEAASQSAADTARELTAAIAPIAAQHSITVEVGANIHVAIVAEGDFGSDPDRRYDIVGSGVNDLFRMGGAAGTRTSDAFGRLLHP
jgi:adenylate cyclase